MARIIEIGSELGVIIPDKVLKANGLKLGDEVDIDIQVIGNKKVVFISKSIVNLKGSL